MSQTIFNAKVLNGYRSHRPKGFYNAIKGHSGVDLQFVYENLFSPITGEIVALTVQHEMGKCIYLKDVKGNVHVFAHMKQFSVSIHTQVKRGDMLGITGNTGSKTTAPHLHYEVVCTGPKTSPFDWIMTRNELIFKGYNRSPIKYCIDLYGEYNITIPE